MKLKRPNSYFLKLVPEFIFRKFAGWRSSPPVVPCKKGFIKNFAKFTRKHLRRNTGVRNPDPETLPHVT